MYSLKNEFEVFKPWILPFMHNSIYFDITCEHVGVRGQLDHSGTKKTNWIRLYASILEETKTMHKISSKTVYEKCLHQNLFAIILSSTKEFSMTGGSDWMTGSSVKSTAGVAL